MRILKKAIAITLILIMILSLSACSSGGKEADSIVSMKGYMTDEYRGIEWEDRHYVPFCAILDVDMTKQIGIVDGDENDRVFAYQNYPETQWLVEYYQSGLMDGPFLFREENVTEIPEGLYSEYKWNEGLGE